MDKLLLTTYINLYIIRTISILFFKHRSMTEKQTFITEEGLEKVRAELGDLKNNKRKEIAGRIQEAKELGDLSENAEYQDAKEEQGFIEGRILELEELVRNVQIIQNDGGGQIVTVGSTIKIEDQIGKKLEYTIVGSSEADPIKGKISNESPLGKTFLGKKSGDSATVETPSGSLIFKIKEII